MKAYFEGRRELFKGLAADKMDLDWTPKPVFHFDFNNGLYKRPDGLENRLLVHLANHEELFGIAPKEELEHRPPIK